MICWEIHCYLKEETNENRFVRTVLSNFPSFMWLLKQFSVVNEITNHHAIALTHLSCGQIPSCKAETPAIVSLHHPLNTPKNNC